MIKSDYWKITYTAEITADVVFEDAVTEAEAKRLFKKSQFEDIVDSEELEIVDIYELEAIGSTEEVDEDE